MALTNLVDDGDGGRLNMRLLTWKVGSQLPLWHSCCLLSTGNSTLILTHVTWGILHQTKEGKPPDTWSDNKHELSKKTHSSAHSDTAYWHTHTLLRHTPSYMTQKSDYKSYQFRMTNTFDMNWVKMPVKLIRNAQPWMFYSISFTLKFDMFSINCPWLHG